MHLYGNFLLWSVLVCFVRRPRLALVSYVSKKKNRDNWFSAASFGAGHTPKKIRLAKNPVENPSQVFTSRFERFISIVPIEKPLKK